MATMDADVSVEEFELLERASSEEVTVELINGRVYVTPAPDGDHDEFVMSIGDQIRDHLPQLRVYQERGLRLPSYRATRAQPDGVVAPSGHFRGQPPWSDPSGVPLLIEVTSGRERDAEVDRVEKRDAYAQSSIPVYLLVDRHRSEVMVFWAPTEGAYLHSASAKFGAGLRLPPPFDFDLDTTVLL